MTRETSRAQWTESRLAELISELPKEKREADPDFIPSEFSLDEVVALVKTEGIEICVPTIQWHSQLALPTHIRKKLIAWEHLDGSDAENEALLHAELAAVRKRRIRSYRRCRYCNKIRAPEVMFDAKTCQRCAQEHLGVVF